MDKKVLLYDYESQPHEITVPNIEDIKSIILEVLSGDEVLIVTYHNDKMLRFDPMFFQRPKSSYDGSVELSVDDLDDLSAIANSYTAMETFLGFNWEPLEI